MRAAVGLEMKALLGVERRIEVAGPAPLGGAGDERLGVGLPDGAPVADGAVEQLVVGDGPGVHVAVRVVPERRLVIEDVLVDHRRAALAAERVDGAHPAADELRRGHHAGARGVARFDGLAVGREPVAGAAGVVDVLLLPEDLHGEADALLVLRHPAQHGHGERGGEAAVAVHLEEGGPGEVVAPHVVGVLEVVVARGVPGRAQLPVEAAGGVSAPAAGGGAQLPLVVAGVFGAGVERDAVDVGADLLRRRFTLHAHRGRRRGHRAARLRGQQGGVGEGEAHLVDLDQSRRGDRPMRADDHLIEAHVRGVELAHGDEHLAPAVGQLAAVRGAHVDARQQRLTVGVHPDLEEVAPLRPGLEAEDHAAEGAGQLAVVEDPPAVVVQLEPFRAALARLAVGPAVVLPGGDRALVVDAGDDARRVAGAGTRAPRRSFGGAAVTAGQEQRDEKRGPHGPSSTLDRARAQRRASGAGPAPGFRSPPRRRARRAAPPRWRPPPRRARPAPGPARARRRRAPRRLR